MYETKLWYFNLLNFLGSELQPRASVSNLEAEQTVTVVSSNCEMLTVTMKSNYNCHSYTREKIPNNGSF